MRAKVNLLVFLAVWKRPEITELCFIGLERLKTHPQFNIQVSAVISEESMIPLCEKYGVHYTLAPNDPLGEKKNIGLAATRQFQFDYMLEIGSDDLILNELLDSYLKFIDNGEQFFGIQDAAYINSETGECRRLTSSATFGAGRMISRKILEKFGFRLWKSHLNRGLDNSSTFSLARHGVNYKQVRPLAFPGVIDIKSKTNIWGFNHLIGVEFDITEIYKRLSTEEVAIIRSLYEFAEQD